MASAIPRPLLVVALVLVAGFLVQASDPTVETCSIGQTWVSNFIKFECYSDGQIVKGVRPIGCVPNDTATGAVIAAGQTYNSPNFVYQCSKPSSNSMEYKIINCLDTTGKTMGIGETRTMSDGTTLECSTGTDGQVLLKKVVVNGCVFQGKVYGMGAGYFSNETTKATVKGKEVLIGVGTGYVCQKLPNGTFVNQAKTCALPNRENGLNVGAYAAVGEVIVKCASCDATPDGVCKLVVDENVACTYNGQAYKQNDFLNDTTGTINYVCNLGKLEIVGCWVQNVWIRERNVKVVNGVQYFCGAGGSTNWTIVDKGCTLSNGTLFPYHLQWETPDAVYQCDPVRTGDNVTAFIRQQRCKINGTLILIDGTVVLPNGMPYKCANNGTMWVARPFNDAEMAAWRASQPSTNSSVVQGDGGSGSGNGVTAGATTTRPTAPPATTPAAVSTTPAPTTLRIEPSTTTTAAEASKVATTPGAGQTTPFGGACHDSFEFCASLAPVCQTHGSAVLQVREILSKSNLTAEEYKKIFNALSLGEENDELKWEVQGLFGSLASGPKDGDGSPCGCSEDDDDCNDRCGRTSSCKRCGIFKRKLRDMVKLACPLTCNTCGTIGHMKDLVGILVRFYRHDCE